MDSDNIYWVIVFVIFILPRILKLFTKTKKRRIKLPAKTVYTPPRNLPHEEKITSHPAWMPETASKIQLNSFIEEAAVTAAHARTLADEYRHHGKNQKANSLIKTVTKPLLELISNILDIQRQGQVITKEQLEEAAAYVSDIKVMAQAAEKEINESPPPPVYVSDRTHKKQKQYDKNLTLEKVFSSKNKLAVAIALGSALAPRRNGI